MVARSPDRATIATFNVRHCQGLDGSIDPVRTARAIASTGAQLVALQELDRGMRRTGGVDQPATLAEATGMHVSFHPTLRRREGEYGLGLASREPLDVTFIELPRLGDEEPRGALVADYRGLWIVATHLSTQGPVRKRQLRAVSDIATDLPATRVILGDLNARSAWLGLLRPAHRAVRLQRGSPRARFFRRIDHVLSGPGVLVDRAWTIRSDASDHFPLVAELAWGL